MPQVNPTLHLKSAAGDPLFSWESPEHEAFELGPRSRLIAIALLIIIVGYALITNSPLMAITFILIGVVGYLLQHQPPEILHYSLTSRGIIAGRDFYRYEDIESFHIYPEPPFENVLSIKTGGTLFNHVHIPLPEQYPLSFYETLTAFIPESQHEPALVDMLEKILHI
jgi:hypothetical protein